MNLKYDEMNCKKCTNRSIYKYDKKTLEEKGSFLNRLVFSFQIKIKKLKRQYNNYLCVYMCHILFSY